MWLSEQLILWEAPPLSLLLWPLSLPHSLSRWFWWFGPLVITFYHSVGIVWRCLSPLSPFSIVLFDGDDAESDGLPRGDRCWLGMNLRDRTLLIASGLIFLRPIGELWNEETIYCEILGVDGESVRCFDVACTPLCGVGGATYYLITWLPPALTYRGKVEMDRVPWNGGSSNLDLP